MMVEFVFPLPSFRILMFIIRGDQKNAVGYFVLLQNRKMRRIQASKKGNKKMKNQKKAMMKLVKEGEKAIIEKIFGDALKKKKECAGEDFFMVKGTVLESYQETDPLITNFLGMYLHQQMVYVQVVIETIKETDPAKGNELEGRYENFIQQMDEVLRDINEKAKEITDHGARDWGSLIIKLIEIRTLFFLLSRWFREQYDPATTLAQVLRAAQEVLHVKLKETWELWVEKKVGRRGEVKNMNETILLTSIQKAEETVSEMDHLHPKMKKRILKTTERNLWNDLQNRKEEGLQKCQTSFDMLHMIFKTPEKLLRAILGPVYNKEE